MATPETAPRNAVLERLSAPKPLVAVEMRPPSMGLSSARSMDTWIDMHHAVRRLTARDTVVFMTDNAVGQAEEENLGHLMANLAGDVSPSQLVPFLTSKHSLEYCLMYAARAASNGFQTLTVLGGDRTVGPPRCVEYAWQLRKIIRERIPSVTLGGWANPLKDPVAQVDFLLQAEFNAAFYLTQIVSHHSIRNVERFVNEARRRGVPFPGVFGVFHYHSANPATLGRLHRFFPVPAEGVTRDFVAGLAPEEITARTIHALREIGVDKVYVSNLGFRKPEDKYRRVLEAIG
ncbi:MAG: hypothetical protein HY700_07390 [Gemmatimonadetes bacterium]|nr:hypothetical protein [Gemmatimonadota bacterium]